MCLNCSNISANITTTNFEANDVEGGCGLIHSLAMEVRVGVWLSNGKGCTLHNPTVIPTATHTDQAASSFHLIHPDDDEYNVF